VEVREDLTSVTFADRALLAGLRGQDYDSDSKGTRALSPKGSGKTMKVCVRAIQGVRGDADPRIAQLIEEPVRLAEEVMRRLEITDEGTIVRVTRVMLGFLAHPVLKYPVAADPAAPAPQPRAEAWEPPSTATREWMGQHAKGLLAWVDACGGMSGDDTDICHMGCKDCGVELQDFSEVNSTAVDELTGEYTSPAEGTTSGFKDLTNEKIPTLSADIVEEFLKGRTAVPLSKVLERAVERVIDSAEASREGGQICTRTDDEGDHVCIKMKVLQSHESADPYSPAISFLVSNGEVIRIELATCTCVKRHESLICAHRNAILTWMRICALENLTGNEGHRAKYWARMRSRIPADAAVVCTVFLTTTRPGAPRPEDIAGEQGQGPKKRARDGGLEGWEDQKRKRFSAYDEAFRFDPVGLCKLQAATGVPGLTRGWMKRPDAAQIDASLRAKRGRYHKYSSAPRPADSDDDGGSGASDEEEEEEAATLSRASAATATAATAATVAD
jgi:hypothetical protein